MVQNVVPVHAMKTYREEEVQLHLLLSSVLDKGELSASSPAHSTPRSRAPGTHQTGGSVVKGTSNLLPII